ncbi:MAG: hypothetical protein Q4D02_00115 [Clostridia bacterium]|nr:hypothetical protein [Clostridia bacterium]
MDNTTNKALMIGVSLFVTVIIASGVIGVINQIKKVYADVYNTDTNLSSRFSEFTKYEETNRTGLDMINAANKYYNDNFVIIEYKENVLNNELGIEYLNNELEANRLTYDKKVYSSVENVNIDGIEKTKIIFIDK